MEPEGKRKQDLVGVPPGSRRKMMKLTENPTKLADFGAANDVLGAKSGTGRDPTDGQEGEIVCNWISIKGIKKKESGCLPGDEEWTD